MRLQALLVALAAILSIGLGSSAQTQQNHSVTFKFRSNYDFKVQVAFFSQDRKNMVWPGGGKAYSLDDSRVHEIKLACHGGEKICYGGWVTGSSKRYWGVGADGKQHCEGCCYHCSDNQTPIINLNSN